MCALVCLYLCLCVCVCLCACMCVCNVHSVCECVWGGCECRSEERSENSLRRWPSPCLALPCLTLPLNQDLCLIFLSQASLWIHPHLSVGHASIPAPASSFMRFWGFPFVWRALHPLSYLRSLKPQFYKDDGVGGKKKHPCGYIRSFSLPCAL